MKTPKTQLSEPFKAPERSSEKIRQLTIGDISAVIQMAWEDRTTFETIKERSGMSESEVIKIMRSELKPSAFKLWRKRMKGRTTKHRALRSPEMKFSDLSIANHRRALGEHMKLASKQRFLNQF
jgi:uncharacterized protein (TIGR03643 family)